MKSLIDYFLTKGDPEGTASTSYGIAATPEQNTLRQNIMGNFLNENQYNTGDPLSSAYPWMSPLNIAQNASGSTGQPNVSETPNLRQQLLQNNIKQFYLDRQREDSAPRRDIQPRGWSQPEAPTLGAGDTSMLDRAIQQSDQYAQGRGFPYYSASDTAARLAGTPESKLAYVNARINDFNNPGGGSVDPRLAQDWYGSRDVLSNALGEYQKSQGAAQTKFQQDQVNYQKVLKIIEQQKALEQQFINTPRRRVM